MQLKGEYEMDVCHEKFSIMISPYIDELAPAIERKRPAYMEYNDFLVVLIQRGLSEADNGKNRAAIPHSNKER